MAHAIGLLLNRGVIPTQNSFDVCGREKPDLNYQLSIIPAPKDDGNRVIDN
jgi:hypothetical protein